MWNYVNSLQFYHCTEVKRNEAIKKAPSFLEDVSGIIIDKHIFGKVKKPGNIGLTHFLTEYIIVEKMSWKFCAKYLYNFDALREYIPCG